MKRFIVVFFIYCFNAVSGQQISPVDKPPIDISMLETWPQIDHPVMSNNGRYAAYTIINQPADGYTLVVTNTDRSWQKEMTINAPWPNGFFSADNKLLVVLRGDSLHFLRLGTSHDLVIANIRSLKYPESRRGRWLAYHQGDSNHLTVKDILNNKAVQFTNVDDYFFDKNAHALIVQTDSSHRLMRVNLFSGATTMIWHSYKSRIVSHSFSEDGKQLAFIVANGEAGNNDHEIWYHGEGMDKAERKVHALTPGVDESLRIGGNVEFSKNGRWLFFKLIPAEQNGDSKNEHVAVNVWSYRDLVLQPEQLRRLQDDAVSYTAVTGVTDNKVMRIEQEDEIMSTAPGSVTGDFVVVNDHYSNQMSWWRSSAASSIYLVSLKDGKRTKLQQAGDVLLNFSLSPTGKYFCYYDPGSQHYFLCNVKSGKIVNVTAAIPRNFSQAALNWSLRPAVDDVAAWENGDHSFLLYDEYDIWKIDATQEVDPICLTNSFGYTNKVKLRLFDRETVYGRMDTLYLTAFNVNNKQNGFFRLCLPAKKDPEQLVMDRATYYRAASQKSYFTSHDDGLRPVKAENAAIWLVKRQSDTEAPNYFITSDFKQFRPLTNICPQQKVNWLTSELVRWKQLDGTLSDGLLYKPENFDPSKKYPVIFNYYRQLSHTCYEFPYPYFMGSNINIPLLVSNGYLVFVPDINYRENVIPVRSAFNAIVSAAQYLSTLPYVNAQKIGLQGHSWGGGQTNYVITHSTTFAAAAEFAGVTNNISSYLTLVPFRSDIEHLDRYIQTEHAYGNGSTLWEKKEDYFEANAVINADKIVTPLLITHNKKDNQIAWRQGIELYMAMRRLAKPCWLLEYDNGRHGVVGKDAKDYTIRLMQFFDHYLKDKPAPVWMTQGIPAKLKRITDGFALDEHGTCGSDCSICVPSGKN